MITYYVATLSRSVLVEAVEENEAHENGRIALHELYADLRERLGHDVPINILTVRPATTEEIQLQGWHDQRVAREEEQNGRA